MKQDDRRQSEPKEQTEPCAYCGAPTALRQCDGGEGRPFCSLECADRWHKANPPLFDL